MKKIIFIILISLIAVLLNNCKKTSKQSESKSTKIVIAKPGLNIREKPNKKSKIVTMVPFSEKVIITNSDKKKITVNGKKGQWVKVKYKNSIGWVFSGYLVKKIPINFFLYNVLDHNEDDLINLIKTYYPKTNMDDSTIKDLKLSQFKMKPQLLPNDKIIIINKNKVYENKVKSLYLEVGDGYFLRFNTHLNISNSIVIKKNTFSKYFKTNPSLNIIKISKNNQLVNNFLNKDFKNYKYEPTVGINLDKMEQKIKEIRNKFSSTLYQLQTTDLKSKIFIISFEHKDENSYNFTAIYNNKKLIYLQNSSFIFSFFINHNYLFLDEWIPHSGSNNKALYIIDNEKLIGEKIDGRFSY